EPFDDAFNPEYLKQRLSGLKKSIKQALMDNNLVVGIGNIYANEVLFECRIDPRTVSKNISFEQCAKLVGSIRDILDKSIKKGGTTIRDFQGADGKLGYFVQDLFVYGHEGEPCRLCGTKIEKIVQGQRSTFFCPHCQK
ncbi:MAG: zinc finger domain-containing protein, partial [Succinivibrio sp.]